MLQKELKGRSAKIVLVAFDLLYLNGRDLRQLALFQRKALPKSLVAGTSTQFSESFEVDGPEMFKHACKTGLEGVVSKVRECQYPQRQKQRMGESDLPPAGDTADWICNEGEPVRWNKVGHGFTPDDASELQDRLKPLIRKSKPYKERTAHRGVWGGANGVGRNRIPVQVCGR